MIRIKDYARTRLLDLHTQPLLRTLEGKLSPARSLQILPYVTFWSNVFQDIIALNLERVTDPRLHAIVKNHYDEDVGHNHWLAADLRLIYRALPDVMTIFDPQYLRAREISYAFMAEVYRAESDWERVTLPIVLEEGGKIMLPALIAHFQRTGLGPHLKALGEHHVEVEAAHALHGDGVAAALATLEVPDDARARAMAMVDRAHATFVRFMGLLDEVITDTSLQREALILARLGELAIAVKDGHRPKQGET